MSKTTLGYAVARDRYGKTEYMFYMLGIKSKTSWSNDFKNATRFKTEGEAQEAIKLWNMVPGLYKMRVQELCLVDSESTQREYMDAYVDLRAKVVSGEQLTPEQHEEYDALSKYVSQYYGYDSMPKSKLTDFVIQKMKEQNNE